MRLPWRRLGLVAGVVSVLVVGVWAIADDGPVRAPDPFKHDRMDIMKCRNYACTSACGETPYVIGVCVDGGNRSAITIECCCCTGERAKNRYFIGG
jgi:hypothetical protein